MHSSFQGFNISGDFEVSDVHGHYTYRNINGDGNGELEGLTGIAQIEAGIEMMDADDL